MQFHSPTTLDEALALLAADDARPLAGGQSLVAMMNLELASPARLVSLRRVSALRGIETRADGGVKIGAMTTHAELAALEAASAGPRLLALAARVVAYPAIRNQGTVGGAVAHADPAADYPGALIAADAQIEIASAGGSRLVPASEFFLGLFETAARPGEVVTAIHVPPGPAGAGAHYEKFSIVAGDFAVASVAAVVSAKGGKIVSAQIAVGACGPKPVRLAAAEKALEGQPVHDDVLRRAGGLLAAACDPPDDQRASGAYRRRIVPELVIRAARAAVETASGA